MRPTLTKLIQLIGEHEAEKVLSRHYRDTLSVPFGRDALILWAQSEYLNPDMFIGKTNKREYCFARYVAWNHMKLIGYSLEATGQIFGGRDHSTIINGLNQHMDLVSTRDAQYARYLNSFNIYFGID